jgi:hypothetical protein
MRRAHDGLNNCSQVEADKHCTSNKHDLPSKPCLLLDIERLRPKSARLAVIIRTRRACARLLSTTITLQDRTSSTSHKISTSRARILASLSFAPQLQHMCTACNGDILPQGLWRIWIYCKTFPQSNSGNTTRRNRRRSSRTAQKLERHYAMHQCRLNHKYCACFSSAA